MAKWPACLAAGAKLEDEEPCTSAAAAALDCFAPLLFFDLCHTAKLHLLQGRRREETLGEHYQFHE